MGHYTSIFQTNEKGVPKRFTPYSADFITVHADLTGRKLTIFCCIIGYTI